MPVIMSVMASSESLPTNWGAVVALAGGPSFHHISQVPDQDVGRDGEVGAATVGVGVSGVVFYRTVTWPVGVEVLPPEQEFDSMPSSGDILLCAFFIDGDQQTGINGRELIGIVDDPSTGVAFHVIDVGLVQGPSVDKPFGTVFLIVDRAVVEAVYLGDSIVVSSVEPSPLGGVEPRLRRAARKLSIAASRVMAEFRLLT